MKKKTNITTITLEETMKMKDRTRKDAPPCPPLPDDFWKNAKVVYPESPKKAIEMEKKSDRLGVDLDEEQGAIRDYKAEKPILKSKGQESKSQAIARANQEEAEDAVYQEKLSTWDETLGDGMRENKGKVVFENGSEECIGSDHGLSTEYIKGYQKGQEQALKWRPPDMVPKQDGTEAILWLTTDKGFADVSAHCYLKDGSWYWWDTNELIKRQDLIMGWQPWPEPPTK
jgi:hypothetical protein